MVSRYFVEPIRNILVPHVGHTPWVAGLPFFIVMALASFISFLARHFIQYACIYYLRFLRRINHSGYNVNICHRMSLCGFLLHRSSVVKAKLNSASVFSHFA